MRNDFIFDGRLASDFNLMLCSIDKGTGIDSSNIISNNTFTTFKPVNADRQFFTGNTYNYVLTKTIQVCKAEGSNSGYFSLTEIEALQRWLCRDDGYHSFAFVNDDTDNIVYNAQISMNVIEYCDRIIGLELTITTDSPYGYVSRTHTYELMAGEAVTLIDYSSKTGSTPLNASITCLADGDYSLTCSFDSNQTTSEIKNCTKGECIDISGLCVISSSAASHDIANDFNYVFPRLSNTLDTNINELTVNLPCNLTITYQIKRKAGI